MTNEQKEAYFKYPGEREPCLSRHVACVQAGQSLAAAGYIGYTGQLDAADMRSSSRDNRVQAAAEAASAVGAEYLLFATLQGPGSNQPGWGVGQSGAGPAESTGPEEPAGPTYHTGPPANLLSVTLVEDADQPLLCWSELGSSDEGSLLCVARPAPDGSIGTRQRVFSSPHAICRLKACALDNRLYVFCWEQITRQRCQVYTLLWHEEEGLLFEAPMSDSLLDSFRPDLAVDQAGRLWMAWDQYRGGHYEIVLAAYRPEQLQSAAASGTEPQADIGKTFGAKGEDWNAAKLVCVENDPVCIWRGAVEVRDDRGIVDHYSFVKGVWLQDGHPIGLHDAAHPSDAGIVLDLREGLLPRKASKGYVGLRRNPQLVLVDGAPLLACEVRPEATQTSVAGQLVCRRVRRDGRVEDALVVDRGGYCYALPPRCSTAGGRLPLACYRFEKQDREILDLSRASLADADPYGLDASDWDSWKRETPEDDTQGSDWPRYTLSAVDSGKGQYTLYWADTHCHTVMSPDAEGDPDELIHYARRYAGIDVVGLVDNDFYPHKVLTRGEWVLKKAIARRFSRNGEFLCPPAWEFTYHDRSLSPSDFNHRAVLHFLLPEGRQVARRTDPDSRTLDRFLETISSETSLVYSHHCSYEIRDQRIERSTEIVSSWRVCMEETSFTMDQLLAGMRLGFIGSSDTHRYVPGRGGALTGIYAEELTPEAILDAYNKRRIIATQGSKIALDLRVAGAFIGDDVSVTVGQSFPIELSVHAPAPIASVEILRDGQPIHRHEPAPRSGEQPARSAERKPHTLQVSCDDQLNHSGTHFYHAKVRLVGDEALNDVDGRGAGLSYVNDSRYPHNLAAARGVYAWTSPVWVTSE
ncbi:MAG: hypothetical protein EA384_00940 [Spirochaetaceae bacterium]|nr:MAG: hypothetical protein EA384_00940 [Spirochaetaceae bacterium]